MVLIGPGGAGKGSVASRLVEADHRLWLSRSWTTRARRPGEDAHAYVFVDRPTFLDKAAHGGFFEWAEFLGDLYGTPVPEPPEGCDVLLEIDVEGARQVKARRPDAVVVLLLPPSPEVQAARLEARGDPPERISQRVERGTEEVAEARALAGYEVVNDELPRAVEEVAGIVREERARRRPSKE